MKSQAYLPLATYPDANSDAVAANAVRMARHLDCGIHAMALVADIPNISNAVARLMINLPEMIQQAEGASKERGAQLLAVVEEEAKRAGVHASAEVGRHLLSILPDVAASRARYYDYTFCGWEAGNETARLLAEAVLFGSGRPVVLLPHLPPVGSLGHVAIAWDGSRVAARAVADAAHLLGRAEKISVLTVVDEKPLQETDPSGHLVASLVARGAAAASVAITCGDQPVGKTLQDRATQLGAGIMVMGAYGHSRIRDFVLGGATRNILADVRMPVMLSH